MKIDKGIVFVLFLLSIVSIVSLVSAAANDTAPEISNISVGEITNTSAKITFIVSQSDARTYIKYDNRNPTNRVDRLRQQSDPNNDIGNTRTITLSGLTSHTKYYYSIHAINGSDSNKSSDSSIKDFTTNETISPTPTVSPTATPTNGNGTWTAPSINNTKVEDTTANTANISFQVNQTDARTRINYGIGGLSEWSSWNNSGKLRTITLSNLTNNTKYYFSIYAYNISNSSYFKNSSIDSFTTKNASNVTDGGNGSSGGGNKTPSITNTAPEKNKVTEGSQSVNFTISFDQIVNITWYLNGTKIQENKSVTNAYYSNTTPSIGTYSITASGTNDNGTASYTWVWTVRTPLSNTGNRVWDGTKGMSTTYIWNSYSFSGFYYDLDNNVSTEQLTIKNIKRTINEGDIEYSTSPIEVNFEYKNFGKYQVIGFMASKYFAGYTKNTTFAGGDSKSAIGNGQLLKVLLDDQDKRTVTVGGTLTLEDGYVLKMKEIDTGAGKGQIWVVLLKDGSEVDNNVVSGGDTYTYSKKVGNTDDLPIVAIHFDSVFRGKEVNAAFVKGIFQISDIQTSIKSGDKYGKMEISSVGSDKITMENKDDISLSRDSTIDLMGDLKIMVADSDTLRFALSVDKSKRTGDLAEKFEIRGTIYPVTKKWTPMNFGLNVGDTNVGFYYDIDEDIGTESLTLESISGNSIPDKKLTYSTSPQEVSFKYSNFGKYEVIGFMAEKYFAGYTKNTKPPNPSTSIGDSGKVSYVAQGELHKVLLDDDKQRTVSVGSTLSLKEGYVLKASDIDTGARTMLITLLKDGDQVDETPLSAGQTYVYTKKIGTTNDVPLILARFDSVFSGKETQAAFIKGLFQISEKHTDIKEDDKHGKMKVSGFDESGIRMTNDGSIGLSSGSNVKLMGNISFKVADSSEVRFYPFVEVFGEMVEISSNQLTMTNLPLKINAGETFNIKVIAGGLAIDGASVTINNVEIGKTNITGYLNYTLPKTYKGKYNVTVSKTGYDSSTKTIDVQEYIEGKLSINVPSTIDQFDTITIRSLSNGTAVGRVTIFYDNITVGTTNDFGAINYTVNSSGSHTIYATKNNYVSISQDIDVRAPFSDFKAIDINVVPKQIYENENIKVISNITNAGTKADTKSIELYVNGSVVDNRSVELAPKETKEINFTYKTSLTEGNYSVSILNQKQLLEVKKAPISITLILAILIVIGAVIIYIATTEKDKLTGIINRYKKK